MSDFYADIDQRLKIAIPQIEISRFDAVVFLFAHSGVMMIGNGLPRVLSDLVKNQNHPKRPRNT